MKDFICKKCGNTTYIIQEKSNGTGVATGLYCAKCGTWHKWLNKQEKILYTTHSEEIDKDKEIARLTAENAELKARLEKAVILPFIHKFYIRDIKGNTVMLYQIVYIDDDNAISTELGNSEEKAEARLAELKGGGQE